MDDLKISHKKSTVVGSIIASLKKEYGKVGEMTVRRGKIHDYLGIKLNFSEVRNFMVDMEDDLDGMMDGLPSDMDGHASTPAPDHLFRTRSNAPKLSEKQVELFHRIVAQM